MNRRTPNSGATVTRASSKGASRNESLRGGASVSQTKTSDRLNSYWAHHRVTALESLQRLLSTPLQSLLTWLVIAIAIALPAVFYVGLQNVQAVGSGWQASGQISIFIHKRAQPRAIEALQEKLQAWPDVSTVVFVSPEQALTEFSANSGFGNALDSLEDNPLPPVLLLEVADSVGDPQQLQALASKISSEAVVDDVLIDMQWLERLHQLLELGQRAVLALALFLALGVLLAVGNTIRLAIENRRDEIVVVKMVGGTNAFVRRPFLYTGFWYGFVGGLLALLLLGIAMVWLSGPVARLADLYQSEFRLLGLGAFASVKLVLASSLLGLLGAWIAVSRHLYQIEPR